MLKVKNLIKNTPSMLHHMHQCRGVLSTLLDIRFKYLVRHHVRHKMQISAKTAKGIQSLIAFAKNSVP